MHQPDGHLQEVKCIRKADEGLAPPSLVTPFIVAIDQHSITPDASSRSLIRHHVMKGKKRTRKRLHSRQRTLGSWINREHDPHLLQMQGPSADHLGPQIDGSAFSCMTFAIEMEPYMREIIHNFITVMKNAMYPIERCVDREEEYQRWFSDLSQDPAYVHTVLYSAQAYFDSFRSQSLGLRATIHMNKAIVFLRKTLGQPNLVITDSLIFVVLALALISEALGEVDAAQKHLHGLCQLIKLRGGIAAIAQKHSLQVKCCRLDLAFALKTGSRPLFFAGDSLSWKLYLTDPGKASAKTPAHTMCDVPDMRLVNTWRDLREFTMAVNLAHQAQRKISPEVFQEALISIQYRLHHLSYDKHDRHDMLRIAMLAYTTTIFLEVHGAPARYRNLAAQLTTVLRSPEQQPGDRWLKLSLWYVFVGGLSVLDSPENYPWLEEQLCRKTQALGLTDWMETRQVLKSFIWVDVVNDRVGKRFFDRAMKSQAASSTWTED